MNYTLETLSKALEGVLSPEMSKLLGSIEQEPGSDSSPFLYLPDGKEMDFSPTQITRLVAKTSNEYARATRLAGLARAQYKIAYASYKYKFRTSLGTGKNKEEREEKAHVASVAEYDKMTLLEAIVELCESIESSARIASESSRRMLLGVDQTRQADARYSTSADALTDNDFTPY